MIKKQLLSITIFLLTVSLSYAQLAKDNIRTITIASEVLSEDREIKVYVPGNYDSTDQDLPVLYILDGQRLFYHGVSLAQTFQQFSSTPQFIVVGISNTYPRRFSHFSTGADAFLEFIEKDVITLVEHEFRTSGERILFGWEYGGGFTVNTLIEKPELFDAYIAASAYPLENKLDRLDEFFKSEVPRDPFLYFAYGKHEGVVAEEAEKLKERLERTDTSNLQWYCKPLENEEHRSTPFTALYHGIKTYYQHYPVLQFATLDEFDKFGDIPALTDYYRERSSRYGFSPEVPEWTKFSVMRCAVRAGDYETFLRLTDAYLSEELIRSLRNNQPYTLSDFYLKHENYKEAKSIYEYLLKKDPNDIRALKKMGDVSLLIGEEKAAERYFRKARNLEKN